MCQLLVLEYLFPFFQDLGMGTTQKHTWGVEN